MTPLHKRHTRAFLGLSFAALFALAPLGAEDNGVFIGAGFQYSYFEQVISTTNQNLLNELRKSIPQDASGNLYGGDAQVGYKQFFGGRKSFGLRYYGFFSGQAGKYIGSYIDTFEGANTETKYKQPATNYFYGVGVDMLYNFIHEGSARNFGVFAGVMVGGSTWEMGKGYWTADGKCATNLNGPCITGNQVYQQLARNMSKDSDGGLQPVSRPPLCKFWSI
ncbi:outer membrane beta-barrel protein [Helicobacter baculiformis]|uniref:Outer membrane beta-barrel protein n=1 Tax=Helicobacter baculiformis TaxID=427351 RepID=A0ABV7ZJ45_9HELI|nr:outer membrane beta-barrel protein [Helicobacter baculiformis]